MMEEYVGEVFRKPVDETSHLKTEEVVSPPVPPVEYRHPPGRFPESKDRADIQLPWNRG